ncbi:DUF4873 domain-containing protein [Nocardioides sp.]|uniref:DUF4873 domain-containing protein n=1 Tax=Nocardioides sp. TaxID=35761 RepID=UPI002D802CCD|nr:DUF4873 domain-containing protein [Nocardioides sp.]HET8961452.1 DUF4873 domain-containing protein [Nocardioides sp.]
MTHEPGEQYAGPAEIVGDTSVEVTVNLRGGFQPIDGRFHWYGRVAGHERLASGDRVTIRTEHGDAEGRLSDVDPWGRLRIAGTGRPPF